MEDRIRGLVPRPRESNPPSIVWPCDPSGELVKKVARKRLEEVREKLEAAPEDAR